MTCSQHVSAPLPIEPACSHRHKQEVSKQKQVVSKVYKRQAPRQTKQIGKKKTKSIRKKAVQQPYPPQVRRSARINARTKGLKVSFKLDSTSRSLEVPTRHMPLELEDLNDLNSFPGSVKLSSLQNLLNFDGTYLDLMLPPCRRWLLSIVVCPLWRHPWRCCFVRIQERRATSSPKETLKNH
jgi:hypothetical protein